MSMKKRKLGKKEDSSAAKKDVVTEEDAKVKTVKTLCYIHEISDMLSEIINQQRMKYTLSSFNPSKAKTKEFLTLIHDAVMCLNERLFGFTTHYSCLHINRFTLIWYIVYFCQIS